MSCRATNHSRNKRCDTLSGSRQSVEPRTIRENKPTTYVKPRISARDVPGVNVFHGLSGRHRQDHSEGSPACRMPYQGGIRV
jgi:hypothetical protein